jgi:hypothetical protein
MIRSLFISTFTLSLLFPFAFANTSNLEQIANDPTWLKLLHYESGLFGTSTEAKTKTFFLSPDGSHSSIDELKASITAFNSKEGLNTDEHPICKFPARYLFLKDKVNLEQSSTCPSLDKFKNRLSVKSISLVFSSYFLDTPASAFGHTLLRFRKNIGGKDKEKFQLLDYAINFSATVTTNNAFLYGFLGLVGGFKGEFASMPYFYKVREYNDYESRDLWEYELNLSPYQLDLIVGHLWEMKQTYFNYYYLTGNCSYYILKLLDIADPSWNLVDRNPYVVVPVDTLKVVNDTPGLVRNVHYRPSKRRVVEKRISSLTKEQQSIFYKSFLAESPEVIPGTLPKEEQALILDTVIDYIDYKRAKEILMENSEALKVKRKFLIARASTGVRSEELKYELPKKELPHIGHDTRRIAIGGGHARNRGSFYTLSYRLSLHDNLDSPLGHNPDATMEMGSFSLRYNPKRKNFNETSSVELDNLDLVHVINTSPLKPFYGSTSWTFKLGAETIKDKGCSYCLAPKIELGAGAVQKWKYFSYLAFMNTNIHFNKELSHEGVRAGIGPHITLTFRVNDYLAMQYSGDYKYYFLSDQRYGYQHKLEVRQTISRNFSVGLGFQKLPVEEQGFLNTNIFF